MTFLWTFCHIIIGFSVAGSFVDKNYPRDTRKGWVLAETVFWYLMIFLFWPLFSAARVLTGGSVEK